MKKTQKILGLPIISISDGLEAGRVKSIIINPERGAIDYIVVDSGIQIFSAKVIPTEDILGIGEYALTIENASVIADISKIPEAIQLLQNDIRVKGTKVLTKKGRLIGEIGDIYVDDEDHCRITGLEFISDITQKKIRLIPRDSVITFGKNLTVVIENVEETLLDSPEQLDPDSFLQISGKKNDSIVGETGSSLFEDTVAITASFSVMEPGESAVEAASASDTATADELQMAKEQSDSQEQQDKAGQQDNFKTGDASALFEQRQRQYLRGRYATKTIVDNMGNVIISEGMQIDDAVFDEAKAKGKLVELVMNNRA